MQVDKLHIAILNQLQLNARISNAEIGRRVGLTAPAVSERIKRMEEDGIIKGFSVNIDFKRLNYSEKVWVGVKMQQGYHKTFLKEADKIDGVTDVIRTTGEYCFFISLIVKSIDELDEILNKLGELGETITFSVLSTPIENKPINL